MVLLEQELISSVSDQVCLESQTERNVQGDVSADWQASQLDESDPFKDSGVFVENFALLEVELLAGSGAGLLDEWLIQVSWVEDVVLEFEESVNRAAQKLGMAQSVGNVLILFFGFQFNVVLVTFGVEMFGDWTVESFVLPLLNVLEIVFLVPWGVGNESVLVGENELLVVDVLSFEAQILKFWLDWAIFINVGINAPDSVLVRSVKVGDGLPYFFLNLKIVLEVLDNFVILFNLGFIVIFVEFGVNILRRVVVLMWQVRILFIIDFSIGFKLVKIFDFLSWSHECETFITSKSVEGFIDSILEHFIV